MPVLALVGAGLVALVVLVLAGKPKRAALSTSAPFFLAATPTPSAGLVQTSKAVRALDPLIRRWAPARGVDSDVVRGLIHQESGGKALTRNEGPNPRTGRTRYSYGAMQVLDETAASLGFTGAGEDLADPDDSIEWGTLELSRAFKRYGNYVDALASYNSGKPYASAPTTTREAYIPNVQTLASLYRVGKL